MTEHTETELDSSASVNAHLPIALYLLAFTALLISAGYVTLTNYHHTTETAAKRSEASADLTAELVANNFLFTKYALQALAGSIEPLVDQTRALEVNQMESINRLLDQRASALETINALYVTDLSGNLLYSSRFVSSSSMPGWSLLRDYLDTHSGDDFVSPLIRDPSTDDFWLFRARQLENTAGEPIGLLVARQSPEALAASLSQLSLSEGQSIAILDESMKLVARRPLAMNNKDVLGQRVSELTTLQFIESGQRSAQAVTKSPIDGLSRFYAFSRVIETPYIVVVGEETSVALADWKNGLWATSFGLLLVGIVGLFFLKQLYRRLAVEHKLIVENRERKALQKSAQINEARLQALVDSIPDLIFVFDKRGHFEFVHAVDESRLLLPAKELLGAHYHDVLPKELSLKFDGIKSEVSASQINQALEYQLFVDGEAKDFEARISIMAGDRGQYNGFLAVVRDITDSKRQEAELRISSTAFETHLGIMITDEAGRILRANQAFSRITGYAECDVVGRTPKILQSGLQDVAFYQHLWSKVNDAGSWEGEIWNRKKNGEVFAEWLTITAVRDASGKLRNYVGTFHDITKRKEAEREVHQLAFYDSLTGLANRALLQERLSEVCKTNSRRGTRAAVLYLDVDQFRAVNDARGYDVGDLVLKSLAGLLASVVRESDTLARISGDEFAILLTDLQASEEAAARAAETIAEKILQAAANPIVIEDHTVQIEISVGIAMIDGKDSPCEQQLQRAEQATQQAKEASRQEDNKRIAFFDPDIQARIVQHVLMEEELRNAITGDELALFFQPQIQQPDNLTGYEALLRWNHPAHGMVSPGIFIPLAEQSRLILPIGRWVMEQACQNLAHWQSLPDKAGLSLAVNVSVVQFQDGDFINHLSDTLNRTGAPPHLLKLEVTESLLMEHPERMAQAMMCIREMGVRFSLDDFGTGYSSMSYLKRLPLDQIKIDQSFVKEVTSSHANAAIVNSIIGLANGLGLEVIAEGVETEAQRAWLVEHGCRNFQGYLFGKPSNNC
ncbi:MAG: bifunctional diguanylate cyclase/phosphodiesterase [Pseudomonadota bacterium]